MKIKVLCNCNIKWLHLYKIKIPKINFNKNVNGKYKILFVKKYFELIT